jgi:ABC-type glycerol-3-phosphate transport system permease component
VRLGNIVRVAALTIATLLALAPILFMIMTAFKSRDDYVQDRVGLPSHPTFHNVTTVLNDPNLATWFLNSVLITVGSVALCSVAGVLAAYPMARCTGWWPRGLLPGLILLLAIPPVVLVVPLFIMMVNLNLLDSRIGVILTYAGLLTPLSTYLMVGFIRGIPAALDEAAAIDGAGRARVLVYVLLPLMRPALVTLAVVSAVYVWNEFLIALLFLQSQESQTIMVGIASLRGRIDINEPLLMAWSLIASLPVVLAYILGQRYFVRGLVAGALK